MAKDRIKLGATARNPEDVREIHKMGLAFAEVPVGDPKRFLSQLSKFSELKEALGIDYLCHGPREGDPNFSQALKEDYFPRLLQIFEIMGELGMNLVTIHLWLDPRFVRPEVILFKIDLLEEIVDRAERRGIEVCIENLSETPGDLEKVFKRIPQLGLTLDLGHAQLLQESNVAPLFFREIPHKIRHVHIHDNLGGSSPEHDLHLPVGNGIINFPSLLKELCETGYDRTITLELKPQKVLECLPTVKALLGM